MSACKVTKTDGTARRIAARRMAREGRYLWFHDVSCGAWTAVARVDRTRVAHVARCITATNGATQWVDQPIPPGAEAPAQW
jgi:hypothetical protein